MLDQNTTTVLTTLITVLGTLGGVALGGILANYFTSKQENTRRKREAIQELYELTMRVYVHTTNFLYEEKFMTDMFEIILPYLIRMGVIANFHLQQIKTQFNDFRDCLNALDIAHNKYFSLVHSSEDNLAEKKTQALRELEQAWDIYDKQYWNLKEEIEKLVR